MVNVLPLTVVTVPKSIANSMVMDVAVVGSLEATWMLTRSPTTIEAAVDATLPTSTVVEGAMV